MKSKQSGGILLTAICTLAAVSIVVSALFSRILSGDQQAQRQWGDHVVIDLRRYVSTVMDCSKTVASLPLSCVDNSATETTKLVAVKRELDTDQQALICNPQAAIATAECPKNRYTKFNARSAESVGGGVVYMLRAHCKQAKVVVEFARTNRPGSEAEAIEFEKNANGLPWRPLFQGGIGCDIKS